MAILSKTSGGVEGLISFINANFAGKLYAEKPSALSSVYKACCIFLGADNSGKKLFEICSYNGSTNENTNIELYRNNSIVKTNTYTSGQSQPQYSALACSNGILISGGNTANHAEIFITFNADNSVVYGMTNTLNSDPEIAATAIYVRSTNDNGSAVINFVINSLNSTSLSNIVYNSNRVDAAAIAEKAYFTTISQYKGAKGIWTLDGENYISNGYWCIKD